MHLIVHHVTQLDHIDDTACCRLVKPVACTSFTEISPGCSLEGVEAFGASNILQEILTVKSDDVTGRSKAYEAIVKGDLMPTPGIPESLNVLLHELRGLGLKVTLD